MLSGSQHKIFMLVLEPWKELFKNILLKYYIYKLFKPIAAMSYMTILSAF